MNNFRVLLAITFLAETTLLLPRSLCRNLILNVVVFVIKPRCG